MTLTEHELKEALTKALHQHQEQTKQGWEEAAKARESKLSSEISENLDKRFNETIDPLLKQIQELQTKVASFGTPAYGGQSEEAEQVSKTKEAFFSLVRKGMHVDRLEPEVRKTLSTLVDPEGGYLLPQQTSGKIVQRVYETTPMRDLAEVVTWNNKFYPFLYDDDDLEVVSTAEKATWSDTDEPDVGEGMITVHGITASPQSTYELLEDSSVDIENWLVNKASRDFGRKEANYFISGTGINQPKGILSYTTSTSTTYARGTLQEVNSGAAAALTADGLKNLENSLFEVFHSGATFMMKRATYGEVLKLKQADTSNTLGDNAYLLNIGDGLKGANTQLRLLMGYPVRFSDDMEAVGAGNHPIAFGDFGMGYTIVDRLGVVLDSVDRITSRGRVKFNFRKRVGGAVTNFQAIKLLKVSS